ncbi:Hypothetical protein Minf_1135 [Methylacidiphilum infernorum V4]|uniref:Uncharacterized protein n=1 Tax=Methylacidiphilum infernorum (isolate V4) TaxID=481448 RepID=B3DV37_METI4|nr:Hypothetical protein Minf_1135 [Methylacidiphilum infernorum V4]
MNFNIGNNSKRGKPGKRQKNGKSKKPPSKEFERTEKNFIKVQLETF